MRILLFGLFRRQKWDKSTKNWFTPVIIFLAVALAGTSLPAQPDFYGAPRYSFDRADTLRGMLRPERSCYDVTFYNLHIRVHVTRKWLEGHVDIHFTALESFSRLQIDLYRNMRILSVEWEGIELPYERDEDAVFITFPVQEKGKSTWFRVRYEGYPQEAAMPPWDGGFVWSADNRGQPWAGVACEGDGASLWWPNKDHLSDEPDSMLISVAVPAPLQCIANGNLRQKKTESGNYTRFDWFVSYPINNYNVTVNIGDYVHFADSYPAADGDTLALDYYVLRDNLEKAKRHFRQVKPVLACFEQYFGKYPFWEDGYALVETPYLGMEHQSAIAYGNQYMRGYLGGMIPSDMDWDYIIVHETGHEYFGNSLGCRDLADMWIHESFTTYMESLFVECTYGYADAVRYLRGQRSFTNREPILGPPDVNWDDWTGSDHYFKGAWVLHTFRHVLGNDEQWFGLLRSFYEKYAYQQIATNDFIEFVNAYTGKDYRPFWEQYLGYPDIPILRLNIEQEGPDVRLTYQWAAQVAEFNMPVLIEANGRRWRIQPENGKTKTTLLENCPAKDVRVARELFLLTVRKL